MRIETVLWLDGKLDIEKLHQRNCLFQLAFKIIMIINFVVVIIIIINDINIETVCGSMPSMGSKILKSYIRLIALVS